MATGRRTRCWKAGPDRAAAAKMPVYWIEAVIGEQAAQLEADGLPLLRGDVKSPASGLVSGLDVIPHGKASRAGKHREAPLYFRHGAKSDALQSQGFGIGPITRAVKR